MLAGTRLPDLPPCKDCGGKLWRKQRPDMPEGYKRHRGRGLCKACWERAQSWGYLHLFEKDARTGYDLDYTIARILAWKKARQTNDQIAEKLGIHERTVRKLLIRAGYVTVRFRNYPGLHREPLP